MPVRIFLSHSSHAPAREGRSATEVQADTNAESIALKRVLDVAHKLEHTGYTVLVDKECVQYGHRWREYIHESLADCHAAALFLSDWSLASAWVRYEATVLAERAWQDREFKLIPVLLPGTDKATLEKGDWRPLALREIHYPKTGDADEIATAIAKFVGTPKPGQSPLDRMREDIGLMLENIDQKILDRACDDCSKDARGLFTERGRALADVLARKVLRSESSGVAEAVAILGKLHPHLRHSPGKVIIEVLEPLWVSQSAASALELAASKALPALRDVALNGWKINRFTAEQYLRRARPKPTDRMLARVSASEPPARVEHVQRELRFWVENNFPLLEGEEPDEIDRFLAGLNNLFVLLPFVPDFDELEVLRAAYQKATFVCTIQGAPPNPVDLPEGVVLLEPPLQSQDIEESARNEVSKAIAFVKSLPQ